MALLPSLDLKLEMLRRGRARSTKAATFHIPVDDLLRVEKVQAFQDLPAAWGLGGVPRLTMSRGR